jgi:hypothetical protein
MGVALGIACAAAGSSGALARDAGEPIELAWTEGDVAGFTAVLGAEGEKPIGFIEYHQHRRGDVLETTRVSRFTDGSSDEDEATARLGDRLEGLRGRSIIRDTRGRVIVDLSIDVPAGRVHGFYGTNGDRKNFDDKVELPPGTYWGPLVFLVVKNFAANAEDGRVRFRTVAPTPSPRVLTLELKHVGDGTIRRDTSELKVERYTLTPSIGWIIDPLVRALAPSTTFFVEPGEPPALAAYEGPRNYTGQEIRLQ